MYYYFATERKKLSAMKIIQVAEHMPSLYEFLKLTSKTVWPPTLVVVSKETNLPTCLNLKYMMNERSNLKRSRYTASFT